MRSAELVMLSPFTRRCRKTLVPVLTNGRQVLHRQLVSAAWTSVQSAAERHVTDALRNGILEKDDDYFRNGIPQTQYKLPTHITLNELIDANSHVDPFAMARDDLGVVSKNMQDVVGSDHPVIRSIANHFFETTGKMVRPTICVLIARALKAGVCPDADHITSPSSPTSNLDIDFNDNQRTKNSINNNNSKWGVYTENEKTKRQIQLAEITELIHTASLLHDDVIDESATRRGVASVHSVYGNKFAILGGDYLLARASVSLARLRHPDVTEIMSTVIEHLVKGEVMQLKPPKSSEGVEGTLHSALQQYVTKSYYKTGSLIANSCKSTALLETDDMRAWNIAWEYGKNVGLAFQVIDDILDFEGCQSSLGKPTLNDLKQGMATIPVLLASEQYPELKDMMRRKFNQDEDVERAVECVNLADSLNKSKEIAEGFGINAAASLLQLNDSEHRSALLCLIGKVLKRKS